MHTICATGNLLTLKEIRLILAMYPKGHPLRKIAYRDVKILRGFAAECGRQAIRLLTS